MVILWLTFFPPPYIFCFLFYFLDMLNIFMFYHSIINDYIIILFLSTFYCTLLFRYKEKYLSFFLIPIMWSSLSVTCGRSVVFSGSSGFLHRCGRNYLCNQCLSQLVLWVRISIRVRSTTLCDKVCQWLATGRWFSLGTPVSSTNKSDRHDIIEILLKVVLNTINLQIKRKAERFTL